MYSRYNYTSGATQAQIVADIVAILTGTTSTASLSSGCDTTNSFINTTYNAAGWSLYDQAGYSHGTATISIASPAVVTKASHTIPIGYPVQFTTTGALPTGLSANTIYYCSSDSYAAGTFRLAPTFADAIAGTNSINTSGTQSGTHTLWSGYVQVLRAAVYDGGGVDGYIYAGLDSKTTSAQINMVLYEQWNNTTHTATNACTVTTGAQARYTVGTAASVILCSSSNYMFMQSNTAAGVGGSATNECTLIAQHNRVAPWDTVAAGYPNSVSLFASTSNFSGGTGYKPRLKAPTGSDVTNSIVAIANSQPPQYKVPDGLGGFYFPLTDLQIASTSNSFLPVSISSVCDVWNSLAYPTNLDEITANGKTYVLLAVYSSTAMLAFPKG